MDDLRPQFQALLPQAIRNRPWIDDMSLRHHDVGPRETIFRSDGQPQRLYFVAKGWLRGATALSDIIRPISTLRIRGDVIGLCWLDRSNHLEDMSTITHAELISLPLNRFKDWMYRDPLLQNFVMGALIRDTMNLQMMSAVIGHMKAPDRLAYFLFIMLNRCRRTADQARPNMLSLPMTQEEIGRLLGLTNVSVNRAFRSLEAEELIHTNRQTVSFLDEARLAARFDMGDRQALIDQLVGTKLET